MQGRKALFLACAVLVAGEVEAAPLTVSSVDRPDPGIVRIAVLYDGGNSPSFRLTARCSPDALGEWVLAAVVTVAQAEKRAVLESREDLARRTDRLVPFQGRGHAALRSRRNSVATSGNPWAIAQLPLVVFQLEGSQQVEPRERMTALRRSR